MSFHEITGGVPRSSNVRREPPTTIDEQLRQAEENFRRLQTQHKRIVQVLNEHQPPPKPRTTRKKKRSSRHNHSLDSATASANADGRHHHLDLTHVPFILGQSTAPSHNVKSNVQNVRHTYQKRFENTMFLFIQVIALLKKHNHQLCLSSKEYSDLLHPRHKSELSPHTLLYLDHYSKPPNRPTSASPVRATRRTNPPTSSNRRPQTASAAADSDCYSRIKRLRREYVILSREHARLNSSYASTDDVEFIGRRMDLILEELGQLQRQYMASSQQSMEQDLNETPIETLRRTKLLQLILKDSFTKPQKH